MSSLNLNISQSEFDTLLIELLMASRLEQIRTRAFLDAFMDSELDEEQKKRFKPFFKLRLINHLSELAKMQPELFSKVVESLIMEIKNSSEFDV